MKLWNWHATTILCTAMLSLSAPATAWVARMHHWPEYHKQGSVIVQIHGDGTSEILAPDQTASLEQWDELMHRKN